MIFATQKIFRLCLLQSPIKKRVIFKRKQKGFCFSKWDRVIFSGFLFLWNSVHIWAEMPLRWSAGSVRTALVINWNCSCLTVACCDWCLPKVLHKVSLAACSWQFNFCLEDYRNFWKGWQWGIWSSLSGDCDTDMLKLWYGNISDGMVRYQIR